MAHPGRGSTMEWITRFAALDADDPARVAALWCDANCPAQRADIAACFVGSSFWARLASDQATDASGSTKDIAESGT
jgi:hypothetical protein